MNKVQGLRCKVIKVLTQQCTESGPIKCFKTLGALNPRRIEALQSFGDEGSHASQEKKGTRFWNGDTQSFKETVIHDGSIMKDGAHTSYEF